MSIDRLIALHNEVLVLDQKLPNLDDLEKELGFAAGCFDATEETKMRREAQQEFLQ